MIRYPEEIKREAQGRLVALWDRAYWTAYPRCAELCPLLDSPDQSATVCPVACPEKTEKTIWL